MSARVPGRAAIQARACGASIVANTRIAPGIRKRIALTVSLTQAMSVTIAIRSQREACSKPRSRSSHPEPDPYA